MTTLRCINNEGYEASLVVDKVYEKIPDAKAERHGMIRVVDEDSDYLFPADIFSETIDTIDLDEESQGACRLLPGSCQFQSCRHNLPTIPDDRCCVLDFAARNGAVTLEDIANAIGVTRERIRQIEVKALLKLRRQER